jgi:cellulose synthase/poly-beta-1,6-N-acetylglucosamine synthase-like glycosyltransferase
MRFEKQKSPSMFVLMLLTIFSFYMYVLPDILSLIKNEILLGARVTLSFFFFFLLLFCSFGFYYLFLYISFLKIIGKMNIKKEYLKEQPAVAVLYTTKNDFNEQAVCSCLRQDYSNFHTFILDDSTDKKHLDEIDRFVKNKNNVTVIRRKVFKGFKAGNLNNGLKNISPKFEYVAIIDADEIIPDFFIKEFIAHFPPNPNLAFIQATHRCFQNQKTLFAQDLSLNNDVHWKYLVPPKNKYGFVMFYGHGAVFKRKFLDEIGGFPEIVSEDLAVSVLLRESGYYGYTDENTICYEETPKTYLKYRKRHEKWVRGTAEFVRKYFWRMIRAKKIPWYEKLDVIMGNLCLFLPVFQFLFLLICGFALPVFLTRSTSIDVCLFGKNFTYNYRGLESQFLDIWTWSLVLPVFLSIIIHYIPVIWEYRKKPLMILRHLKNNYVVSAGMTIFTFIGFFGGLFSEYTYFPATGDEDNTKETKTGWIKGYLSDLPSSFHMELAFGYFLMLSFILTLNLWILPASTSMILSYYIYKYRWDNPWIQKFLFIPFASLIIVMIFVFFATMSG